MKKYFKLLLTMFVVLVTALTLTSCSKTMTKDDMLKEIKAYNNAVTIAEFSKEFDKENEKYSIDTEGKILELDFEKWNENIMEADKDQLVEGKLVDSSYTKAKGKFDHKNQITVYEGEFKNTESSDFKDRNFKGSASKKIKGGYYFEENKRISFDDIKGVKDERSWYSNALKASSLEYKYYIDSNVFTAVRFDDKNEIKSIEQSIFEKDYVIRLSYYANIDNEPYYNNVIEMESISKYYSLSKTTVKIVDGSLSKPDLSSYVDGGVYNYL